MDLSIGALGLYALGALTLIWPKRLELAAHYTGMGLAVVASIILLGFSLLALVGVTGGITFQTGRYLLAVDGWSAVFFNDNGPGGDGSQHLWHRLWPRVSW